MLMAVIIRERRGTLSIFAITRARWGQGLGCNRNFQHKWLSFISFILTLKYSIRINLAASIFMQQVLVYNSTNKLVSNILWVPEDRIGGTPYSLFVHINYLCQFSTASKLELPHNTSRVAWVVWTCLWEFFLVVKLSTTRVENLTIREYLQDCNPVYSILSVQANKNRVPAITVMLFYQCTMKVLTLQTYTGFGCTITTFGHNDHSYDHLLIYLNSLILCSIF